MKIIFCGTPEFACPFLSELAKSHHEISLVCTQPDKPAGRGLVNKKSPVKILAESLNMPVLECTNKFTEEAKKYLRELQPDCIINVAYGVIFCEEVLNIPKFGCLNVHPSILPKFRGATPIQSVILAGEKETGVSIIKMVRKLDAGPILIQIYEKISNLDTTENLSKKLAISGSQLLMKLLSKMESGRYVPIPQDEHAATYCNKLKKADALINWNQPAEKIARLIRAFNPTPVAHSTVNHQVVKIFEGVACDNSLCDTQLKEPGIIVAANKNGVDVLTIDNKILRILKIQLPGKKAIPIAAAMNSESIRKLFSEGSIFN